VLEKYSYVVNLTSHCVLLRYGLVPNQILVVIDFLVKALILPSSLLLNSLAVFLRKILINNFNPHKVEKFPQKIIDKLLILCLYLKQEVR